MQIKIIIAVSILFSAIKLTGQCHFVPSTTFSADTVTFSTVGSQLQSYGCAPIDPTYWIVGDNDASVTATFFEPQDFPSFRVWGMNSDDTASVLVNGTNYPLNVSSAIYAAKVVCGLSPGAEGIAFANGNLVGFNSPGEGNFSYQDIQLIAGDVTSIKVTGIAGAGWGFAGVSVKCPLITSVNGHTENTALSIYPNPAVKNVTIIPGNQINNGMLELVSLTGQLVKTATVSGKVINIDRGTLPAGTYFFRIVQDGKLITRGKLIFTTLS